MIKFFKKIKKILFIREGLKMNIVNIRLKDGTELIIKEIFNQKI
jgi:hypothetical protein